MTSSAQIQFREADAGATDREDFCLAERLLLLTDEELNRLADQEAAAEVASSAYEGIPLDQAALRTGLLETYRLLIAKQRNGETLG